MSARVASVALLVCWGAACLDTSFHCRDDATCQNGGASGRCEATGFCSFPAAECASGYRYGRFADAAYANQCVTPRDGGAPSSFCTTTTCGCNPPGPCSGSCGDGCSVDCSASCGFAAGATSNFSCSAGAECTFTAAATSQLTCSGGATCHVACTGACTLRCFDATCDLRCNGDASPHAVSGATGCS